MNNFKNRNICIKTNGEKVEMNLDFSIDTMEDALRYAYSLSETQEKISEIIKIAKIEIAHYEEKINQINIWRDEAIAPLKEYQHYLQNVLADFHKGQWEELGKKNKKKHNFNKPINKSQIKTETKTTYTEHDIDSMAFNLQYPNSFCMDAKNILDEADDFEISSEYIENILDSITTSLFPHIHKAK